MAVCLVVLTVGILAVHWDVGWAEMMAGRLAWQMVGERDAKKADATVDSWDKM